jgi:CP family cyanate transporter-like MFS transporter
MRKRLAVGFPIFLASINMRAGLVLIGPLIPILEKYFNLTPTQMSFLAAIPLLCFAGSSLIMGFISRLGSSNRIITRALVTLSIALIARAFSGLFGLFVFTFLMGISIAIMNYEIPAWVKEHAPDSSGLLTGVYVTIMGGAGAISVAISVPLAENSSLSWRMAMLPWMFLAVITSIYWLVKMRDRGGVTISKSAPFWRSKAFKNPIAWALVFFFGFESMTFYATATWFPSLLITKDFTLSEAALAVSISGVIGSAVGLAAPHYLSMIEDKRLVLTIIALISGISFFMFTVQSGAILFLWLCTSNMGISIAFPTALLLCGIKSDSPEATRNMSTMMQSLGYIISACGPVLMGSLYESSNSWNVAMYGVVAMSFMQLLMGLVVGKPSKIEY